MCVVYPPSSLHNNYGLMFHIEVSADRVFWFNDFDNNKELRKEQSQDVHFLASMFSNTTPTEMCLIEKVVCSKQKSLNLGLCIFEVLWP